MRLRKQAGVGPDASQPASGDVLSIFRSGRARGLRRIAACRPYDALDESASAVSFYGNSLNSSRQWIHSASATASDFHISTTRCQRHRRCNPPCRKPRFPGQPTSERTWDRRYITCQQSGHALDSGFFPYARLTRPRRHVANQAGQSENVAAFGHAESNRVSRQMGSMPTGKRPPKSARWTSSPRTRRRRCSGYDNRCRVDNEVAIGEHIFSR
jgi:hypothetical protein